MWRMRLCLAEASAQHTRN